MGSGDFASSTTVWANFRLRSEERRVGKECICRGSTYQAEDGIRDLYVTGVQTCALPISPGTDRERLRVRPGNVPEGYDGRIRQLLLDHPGQQREVVVLHQHDGVGRLRFFHHGLGELPV